MIHKQKEGLNENYLSGIDVIYWINLDSSNDRFNDMTQMFKDDCFEGIPKERISAFDAKLNPTMVLNHFVLETKKQPDTAYGCLLSHLESIRTFNNSDYQVALIFEDDVTLEFKKYWKESVKQIMKNAPSDWDIIMLSYILLGEHSYYDWNNVNTNYIKELMASTQAYIINKKGSRKIIDSTYKNNKYVLDPTMWTHSSDGYIYLKTNTYCYKYPMFTYKDDIDSTINNAHLDINKPSKDAIVSEYKKLYPDL